MNTDNSALSLAVVIPVSRMDWHLACKLLRWWKAMIGGAPNFYPTIALVSKQLTDGERDALGDSGLPNLSIVTADVEETGYFGSANRMFRFALDLMEKRFPDRAMLWMEADCVPLSPDWLDAILVEYRACGKPFMGDHYHGAINHMTGNGVYHPGWRTLAPSLAQLPGPEAAWGWDSMCAHETFPQSYRAATIQQIWRPQPFPAQFAAQPIRDGVALFHQCKDGTLIDVLCERAGLPPIPLAPQLCESTYAAEAQWHGDEHLPAKQRLRRPGTARPLTTSFLIVTFKRDMDFLRYCLRSVEKYATGFAGVDLVVPVSERGLYDWTPNNTHVHYFDEPTGKGMLAHEFQIMHADEWCPDSDVIVHLDPDCCLWRPVTPKTFVQDGQILATREPYDRIGNPNRHIWKRIVEEVTGIEPRWDFMLMHPNVHWREVYLKARQVIEQKTGRRLDLVIMNGRNEFPQSFAEFPVLGTVAEHFFGDRYRYTDYDKVADFRAAGVEPGSSQYIYRLDRDACVECWSHGGIGSYRALLDSILAGNPPSFVVK